MTLQVILSILLTYPLNVQAAYTPSEGGEGDGVFPLGRTG